MNFVPALPTRGGGLVGNLTKSKRKILATDSCKGCGRKRAQLLARCLYLSFYPMAAWLPPQRYLELDLAPLGQDLDRV